VGEIEPKAHKTQQQSGGSRVRVAGEEMSPPIKASVSCPGIDQWIPEPLPVKIAEQEVEGSPYIADSREAKVRKRPINGWYPERHWPVEDTVSNAKHQGNHT
jgi:hypothetical protein